MIALYSASDQGYSNVGQTGFQRQNNFTTPNEVFMMLVLFEISLIQFDVLDNVWRAGLSEVMLIYSPFYCGADYSSHTYHLSSNYSVPKHARPLMFPVAWLLQILCNCQCLGRDNALFSTSTQFSLFYVSITFSFLIPCSLTLFASFISSP